jgi:hypothetical protein
MKRSILVFLMSCLPGLAVAQTCADIQDDTARLACFDTTSNCASIQSATERLACWDRAHAGDDDLPSLPAEEHREAPVRPPSAQAQVLEPVDGSVVDGDSGIVATVSADSPDKFGEKKPLDAPRQYIEATIIEIKTTGLKIDYLQLDNGQVWRETQDSRMRFKEGRKVTITEGILNSYDLQMEGYNKIVKVKRVR